MRRSLIALSLASAGLLSTGYVLGQFQGTTPASAAAKHTKNRPAGHAKPHATGTAAARPRHADGTVTAVNGDTITVQADNDRAGSDEYTQVTSIILTSSTTFKPGTTRASIVKGAQIVAEGSVSSDGKTLTATSVGVGGHGGGSRAGHTTPHADGTVVGISGNTISVKPDTDAAGSSEYTKVTAVVLTDTTILGRGTTRASIVAGAGFTAEGTLSTDGTTLTATRFAIHGTQSGAAPHHH
jgi:hypothetical protein